MSREHARSHGHGSSAPAEEGAKHRDPRAMALHRRSKERLEQRESQENPTKLKLLMAEARWKESELTALLDFEHARHRSEETDAEVGPEFGRQLGEKILDSLADDLRDAVSEAAEVGKETMERASVVYGAAKGMIESEISRGEKLTAARAASVVVRVARQAIEKASRERREKIEALTDEQLDAIQGLLDAEGDAGALKMLGLPPIVKKGTKDRRYLEDYKNLVRDAKPMHERGGEIADREKIHEESGKEIDAAERDLEP